LTCELVTLFIFLEKTKQKSVMALESLRFQGRSPRQVEQLMAWLSPDAKFTRTILLIPTGKTNAYKNII